MAGIENIIEGLDPNVKTQIETEWAKITAERDSATNKAESLKKCDQNRT